MTPAIPVLPEDERAGEKRREWDLKKGLRLQFAGYRLVMAGSRNKEKPRQVGLTRLILLSFRGLSAAGRGRTTRTAAAIGAVDDFGVAPIKHHGVIGDEAGHFRDGTAIPDLLPLGWDDGLGFSE